MGYIDVWEHSGGVGHIDADQSPIFEDLYSLELGFMDIYVTSVCVFFFCFSFIGFSDVPTPLTVHFS